MISDSQSQRLQQIFESAEGNEKKLSEWENGFLSDIQEKYEKWGDRLNLTSKQWDCLERILGKVS